jgi:glucokinase
VTTEEILAEHSIETVAEHSMARFHRKAKSAVLFGTGMGRQALVFDETEVLNLLRAAVEQEGGQKAFASRHGLERTYVNMVLNGRARIRDSLTKALGVRKAYVAE